MESRAPLTMRIVHFLHNFKNKLIDNIKKEENKGIVAIGLLLIVIFSYLFIYNKTKAYSVIFKGEEVGSVKTELDGYKILDELEQEIKKENDASVYLDDVVTFERTNKRNKNLSSANEIKSIIKPQISYKVSAYIIEIDGEAVGAFKTGKEAEDVLEEIKNEFIKEDGKYENVEILEKLDIKNKKILLAEINEKEDVLNYIKTGGEQVQSHTVEVGESFWTIAKIYNTTVEEIEKANPGVIPERLKPGDEVKLFKEVPKLTVVTTEKKEVVEDIVAEVEIKYDDSKFKTEKEVKVEGSNGQIQKTVLQKKHNGVLVEEDIVEEKVVKEPVTKVVVQGTKEVPRTVATGSFMMPTRGRITSGFGRRWGRMHRGLDIAASHGTAIKAADGGTVSFAGWNGSYGNMIEIDHGNGYKTRYAHCSKLVVSKGTKVAKGDHIANVGNTGRSTGAHLHLEVIKNGVHQNPSNFVK